MAFMIDTHLLLWAAVDSRKLSRAARKIILGENTELLFSAAAIWEVVVKAGLGRADFQIDAALLRRGLLAGGWREVGVTGEHAIALSALPTHHRDPFDRIMIAQSRIEGHTLVTGDAMVAKYGDHILKV